MLDRTELDLRRKETFEVLRSERQLTELGLISALVLETLNKETNKKVLFECRNSYMFGD